MYPSSTKGNNTLPGAEIHLSQLSHEFFGQIIAKHCTG